MTQTVIEKGYIVHPPQADYGVTNPIALCFLLWRLQARRVRRLV